MKYNLSLPDNLRQQLDSRKKEKNFSIYSDHESTTNINIITSSSDVGVMRNGGRQGAYLGPKVILNELGKFQSSSHKHKSISIKNVTELTLEIENFEKSQINQSTKIQNCLNKNTLSTIVHLGGGHDHIFPLLMALENNYEKKEINILNIDAHLDTRIDKLPHSGTPFRQYDQHTSRKFQLNQLGIQQESNTVANFTDLKNGIMSISSIEELAFSPRSEMKKLIERKMPKLDNTLHVLSIDIDALDGSDFTSCSAVNPCGISFHQLCEIVEAYKENLTHPPIVGIYEYNPIYDDVSNSDAKKIAWIINQIIK